MKQHALVLVFIIAFQSSGFSASDARGTQESAANSDARTQIQKYGTAKKQLKVTLRDGNEVKGYVSRSDDVSFDLSEKSGHVSKLRYEEVDKVHRTGLSRGAKMSIVVGSAVVVTAAVIAIEVSRAKIY